MDRKRFCRRLERRNLGIDPLLAHGGRAISWVTWEPKSTMRNSCRDVPCLHPSLARVSVSGCVTPFAPRAGKHTGFGGGVFLGGGWGVPHRRGKRRRGGAAPYPS